MLRLLLLFIRKKIKDSNFFIFFPIKEVGQGWQKINYNIQGNNANHKEQKLFELTFQFQGFIKQHSNLTAGDLVRMTRMIINSLSFVESMRKMGIGIQRATDIISH